MTISRERFDSGFVKFEAATKVVGDILTGLRAHLEGPEHNPTVESNLVPNDQLDTMKTTIDNYLELTSELLVELEEIDDGLGDEDLPLDDLERFDAIIQGCTLAAACYPALAHLKCRWKRNQAKAQA
jgi:hypothetical protein